MASEDRRIPIVAVDKNGFPKPESLNSVIRQIFTNIQLLEGRMGIIDLLDGISAAGPITSTQPGTGQWYQSDTIASNGTYLWDVETVPNTDLYQLTGTGDGIIVKAAGTYLLSGHVTASAADGGTTHTVSVDGTVKAEYDQTDGGGLTRVNVASISLLVLLTANSIVSVELVVGDEMIGDADGISSKISLYRLN